MVGQAIYVMCYCLKWWGTHLWMCMHFFFFLLNNVLKLMSSCPLLSLQFAPSSPVGCTPSLDSTTRSPWTPWPRSAAPCTPPLSHPVTPPIMRCSLSSRCAPPSGALSSAYSLTTSGRSSSTSTTPSEVGDKAGLESGLKGWITMWNHRKCFSDSE